MSTFLDMNLTEHQKLRMTKEARDHLEQVEERDRRRAEKFARRRRVLTSLRDRGKRVTLPAKTGVRAVDAAIARYNAAADARQALPTINTLTVARRAAEKADVDALAEARRSGAKDPGRKATKTAEEIAEDCRRQRAAAMKVEVAEAVTLIETVEEHRGDLTARGAELVDEARGRLLEALAATRAAVGELEAVDPLARFAENFPRLEDSYDRRPLRLEDRRTFVDVLDELVGALAPDQPTQAGPGVGHVVGDTSPLRRDTTPTDPPEDDAA